MPPSGRAGKGRAPAALKGAALRAAALHPRLFMVSLVGLSVGCVFSLLADRVMLSVPVPVPVHSAASLCF
ncbi:hypothetical protein DKU76_02850 [Salmonella enterica subsp. enterica serovar Napoli]|jgi:hypothetical protein|nr:hypothetical protein [Salmonella enterica subsp. enterica serovar Napoli]EDU9540856.1 hypothetical protein [Salmonella enterica subsp. enterica]EJO4737008.1 hypothetical protein [Salmonella enterica]